jgi:hypothetical protein
MARTAHAGRAITVLTWLVLSGGWTLRGQQHGQYQPGQYGLNAGVLPDPGFTYADINLNYDAGQLNLANGNPVKVKGTLNIWAIENGFFYVPKFKVLGAKFAPLMIFPTIASGALTLPLVRNGITAGTGDFGLADTWFQPVTLGWHLPRADVWAVYAFVAPTGRYSPGASNNIGSGYWGNDFSGAGTFYLTKNMGTTANFMGNWEIHGSKTTRSSDITTAMGTLPVNVQVTPGAAFTDEWGLGQAIPLNKPFLKTTHITKVAQLGLIGYDQAQVSLSTSNNRIVNASERLIPFYYTHAAGVQANYIDLARDWNVFFKWEHDYRAKGTTQGTTIVFGFVYTYRIPKPTQKAATP